MTIVIFVPRKGSQVQRIVRRLEQRGAEYRVLPLSRPDRWNLSLRPQDEDGRSSLGKGRDRVSLDQIKAFLGPALSVDVRRTGWTEESQRFAAQEWVSTLWSLYLLTRSRLWVNPLEAYLLYESKPFQNRVARNVGFLVPDSLVTTDPSEVRRFFSGRPGGAALKRVSHPPRIEFDPRPAPSSRVLFTTRLTLSDLTPRRLANVPDCPVHLQEYVEKATEVRSYVVGQRVLSIEILSQDVEETREDWRRYPTRRIRGRLVVDPQRWKCRQFDLPSPMVRRCLLLSQRLQMRYAAIDMIRRPDGRFVFLEANASGAFGFAEDLAGLPLSRALADLLMEAERAAG